MNNTPKPGRALKIAELILIAVMIALVFILYASFRVTWLNSRSFWHTSISPYHGMLITGVFLFPVMAILAFATWVVGRLRKQKTGEPLFPHTAGFFSTHKWARRALVSVSIVLIIVWLLYTIQPLILFYPGSDGTEGYYLRETSKNSRFFQVVSVGEDRFTGWKYSHEGDTRAVLYFCGNMQTASDFMEFLDSQGHLARTEDTTVVCIDYPGYGHSQGAPEERSINEMTEEAAKYVMTLAEPGNITVVGYSIGTGPATYAATLINPGKLVLVAPYNNMTSLYNTRLNIFYGPIKLLARYRFPSDERLPQLTCPIYIYASSYDRTIPIRLSRALAECNPSAVMCDDVGLEHGVIVTAPVIWEEVFR